MPLYEYKCAECSHKFELRRSFSDESQVHCPECDSPADRIFSPVPIIFKGSGFYVTDHRSNHGHSEPAPGKEESKTSGSGDAAPTSSGSED